ncbi:MAG TPA: hypothetical protein VHX99_01665 [Rhizomicrobium sp.]|jgi:hypothetical protein|nr:hypothetical protein [Rhizomicrobium sp.]
MDKPLEQTFLNCRKCGSSGTAVWENPASDLADDRRLLSLSGGFYQRPLVGVRLPEIICDHCGTGQPH